MKTRPTNSRHQNARRLPLPAAAAVVVVEVGDFSILIFPGVDGLSSIFFFLATLVYTASVFSGSNQTTPIFPFFFLSFLFAFFLSLSLYKKKILQILFQNRGKTRKLVSKKINGKRTITTGLFTYHLLLNSKCSNRMVGQMQISRTSSFPTLKSPFTFLCS